VGRSGCTGADGYRFSGKAVCDNGPVRGDQLEQVVWNQVRALLQEPRRVADEYRRRIAQARDGAAIPDEVVRLDRQMTSLRRGIGRLIDSYAEGVIDKTEFEPRIAGLKQRMSQLQARHQAAREAAETERDLALVVSRLEDFSAKVITGLDHLDRLGMRDIIRTVVRRIEINDSRIEVVFRVPSPGDPPGPGSSTKMTGSWQHCTSVGRTNLRLDQPQSPPRARFRALCDHRRRFHSPRDDPPHAAPVDQINPLSMNPNFLDRL
jgi:site-specific DNA recombinase